MGEEEVSSVGSECIREELPCELRQMSTPGGGGRGDTQRDTQSV